MGSGISINNHYMLGDDLTKSFTSTGMVSAESSRWVFAMTDFTALGVVSTFNVQINGVTVGNFDITGTGAQKTNNFDLTFNHAAPLAGQNYALRMVATSTVPNADGFWNWYPGGSVTLNGVEVASYWDVNGATAGSGTTSGGVYNWSSASWSSSAAGSAATGTFTSGQKAVFSAGSDGIGPFTVNVNGTFNVGGITFQEGGVTLAPVTGGIVTLVAPTIDVQTAGATATIASSINGSVGLTKLGPGKLILSGPTGYTGNTIIGQGTLQLGDGGTGAITLAGTITLGNALTGASDVALLVNRSGGGAISLSNAITVSSLGTGTVTIGSNLSSQSGATTFTGPLTLNRATTMTGNNTDRTTYSGIISGNVGTLTVTGGVRTTWQNNNTFDGNVVVTGAGNDFASWFHRESNLQPNSRRIKRFISTRARRCVCKTTVR